MHGQDASSIRARIRPWMTVPIGGLIILALFFGVRTFYPLGRADAQAPPRGASPQPTRTGPAVSMQQNAGDPGQVKVMAVVNGRQFTRDDLSRECLRRYGEDVLQSFINKHLILNACRQAGITITEQDINDEVKSLAGKFGLTTDRYLEMLKTERNIDPQQYRRDIIWPTLALRRLAREQIDVTPQEVQAVLETETGPRVKARLLAVKDPQKAQWLHTQATANPEKFGELAKEHSEDASSSGRGWIPPIRMHTGPPEVEQIVFRLKPGDISPVIRVADQYLIVKCEGHVPATAVPESQKQAVQERIVEHVRESKLREVAAGLFKQLQERARVQNIYNDPRLRQQYPGVAVVINDQQITLGQLSEECIARHGAEVLEGEINRMILAQALEQQGQTITREDIQSEIARAADAYGYESVEKWLASVQEEEGVSIELYEYDAVWPSVALKKLAGKQIQVAQEDLDKGFVANYGQRVEVLAIVLGSQRQAQQVWEMARNNPTEEFFGQLANQYSIEPASKANFGRVPPIQRYGGQSAIEEQAFKLEQPGELSDIVAAEDKFVILKYLGRTRQVQPEMTPEIRDILAKDIFEKKLRLEMARKFDELRATAQIDNFLAGTSQAGAQSAATADPHLGRRIPFGTAPR